MDSPLMGDGYTKLFSDIIDSSIWDEDKDTRIVWITLLALSNADGYVRGSVGWLAKKSRVPVKACARAVKILEAPDPHSRTEDNEGRRIQYDGRGWFILNHALFRARNGLSQNPRRVYQRNWMRDKRAREEVSTGVNNCQQESTPASASGDKGCTGTKGVQGEQPSLVPLPPVAPKKFQKPDMPEMQLYAAKIGLPPTEIDKFFNYYESNGWKVGRNPMKSWEAAMRTWSIKFREHTTTPKNGNSEFWKLSKELELIEKELIKITARASHTAHGITVEERDKVSYDRLRKRRDEIKTQLHLK